MKVNILNNPCSMAVILLAWALFGSFPLAAQNVGVISGRVEDESGSPLQSVNVFLLDSIEGAMTDENGRFRIETARSGNLTLRVSCIGYEPQDIAVVVSPTQPVNLTIRLQVTFIEVDPITVSASSFTMADEEGQTLTSMDVVTTAGAAADIFRAIQTLPGVTQVDEGAGMFVRGGDVSETITLLDQATLSHPYRYESDTGGYFGMISPFLLSGTYFASGAFSAKYGNALSGVLAMESLDLPDIRTLQFSAGLAAISLGADVPLIPNKFGLRFSGNYSDTWPLFKVNGGIDRFEDLPVSWDGNLSLIYRYSHRGQLKVSNYYNQDDIGVYFEAPRFDGTLISGSDNWLSNLQWQHLFGGDLLLKSSVSRNLFHQALGLGSLDLDISDQFVKWRTDLIYPLSDKLWLNSGFEVDRLLTNISGSVPEFENDYSAAGPIQTFATDYDTYHAGWYLEGEISMSSRLFAIGGLRTDYLQGSDDFTVAPRISIGYRPTGTQILKLAAGLYHQYPKAQYRDPAYGNPDLKPLQALHYVAGYEFKSELTNLRLELYYKDYDNLPLEVADSLLNYTNEGFGQAYGADVFLKGTLPLISGWLSYSYLVSEREELDHSRLVPTDYDIRHNFTAALKSQVGMRNSASLTYRYTSGKPYTPALEDWNSERLPPIQRLDFAWSYFRAFGEGNFLVLYAAVSNLLDRQNIYGYIYSPDYEERTVLKSTYGRNYYFGFTVVIR
ncbi:MAG: TonB-dependent receptor domain-containing protein [Candidatus Neomarinimicrobiota bacterium]